MFPALEEPMKTCLLLEDVPEASEWLSRALRAIAGGLSSSPAHPIPQTATTWEPS